ETEAEAGRQAAADLLVSDCASLLRHRRDVYDTNIVAIIDELGGAAARAADLALRFRGRDPRAGPPPSGHVLAALAIEHGGDVPDDVLLRTLGQRWRTNVAWMLFDTIADEAVNLPPPKSAGGASFLVRSRSGVCRRHGPALLGSVNRFGKVLIFHSFSVYENAGAQPIMFMTALCRWLGMGERTWATTGTSDL